VTSPAPSPTAAPADRFGWLDFAKGLCIVSVVWMWTDKYLELHSGWFHQYARFSLPFRMPDFFLISGLLLGRVIGRPWRNYLDTRVVHYLYFLVIWTFVYLPLSWLAERPGGILDALREIWIGLTTEPKGNLWFMQMLAIYFVLTRLTRRVPAVIMLGLATAVYLYPLPGDALAIAVFGDHYVFFYLGYLLAPRILQGTDWMQRNRRTALLALGTWAIGNYLLMVFLDFRLGDNRAVALVLRGMGVAAVITVSALIWNARGARWLTHVGRNSIVVYLGFYIPLSFLVQLGPRLGLPEGSSAVAFAFWSVSIISSLIAFEIARRLKWLQFLYERPQWARLPASGKAPPAVPVTSIASVPPEPSSEAARP
jgi:uncharacterized membrane protein YcfT